MSHRGKATALSLCGFCKKLHETPILSRFWKDC